MSVKKIDAALVRKCFLAGAAALQAKKEYINELNVFPVPDGDTGTNMTMTIMSAADEVAALEEPSMETICKAISSGSLRVLFFPSCSVVLPVYCARWKRPMCMCLGKPLKKQ